MSDSRGLGRDGSRVASLLNTYVESRSEKCTVQYRCYSNLCSLDIGIVVGALRNDNIRKKMRGSFMRLLERTGDKVDECTQTR